MRSIARRCLSTEAGTSGAAGWSRIDPKPYQSVPPPSFLAAPHTASVIGAPMTWGQPLEGTDHGPRLLREAGLTGMLAALGWRVQEHGDLAFAPPAHDDPNVDPAEHGGRTVRTPLAVGRGNEQIYRAVRGACEAGHFSLCLGGDHSVALGSTAGVLAARPDAGVLWVDAHADLNTPATSPSGNLHGMPLAFLMRLVDPAAVPGFEWLADAGEGIPALRPEQVAFVGLRDIDAEERRLLAASGVRAIYTMHEVDKFGIGRVMEMATAHLAGRPLHMSYDVDAVDPEFAPSTGTLVRGGFNYREAMYVAEAVAETGRLGSMDLVEVNPSLQPEEGDAGRTVQLGARLVEAALGSRIFDPIPAHGTACGGDGDGGA